jgi:glycosyltransferase involved in cell wall biosynthesis
MLRACLASILEGAPDLDFDVWVVDSSPSDVRPLLQDLLSDPRLHLVRSERRLFPGAARDLGIRSSKGEIIVFIDCDCAAGPGWPRELVEGLERDPGLAACGGGVENGTPRSYWGTAEYLSEFGHFTPRSPDRRRRFVPTCNMALRRSDYFESGGLKADMEKGSDVALGHSFLNMGRGIGFIPEALVHHFNRTEAPGFLRNQYRIGRGSARNFIGGNQPYSAWGRRPSGRLLLAAAAGPLRFVRVVGRVLAQGELPPARLAALLPALLLGAACFWAGYLSAFLRPQG